MSSPRRIRRTSPGGRVVRRSGKRGALRKAAAAALLLALCACAAANPFYGDSGGTTPAAPVVRPGPLAGLQADLKNGLSDAFDRFGTSPSPGAWAAVLGAAFLYGIIHAAGPGHRKTVIFSLFLGKRTRAWEPLAAGFLSAGIHAFSGGAILLVLSILRGVLASFSNTERIIVWMDGITLCALIGLALFLLAGALRRAVHGRFEERAEGGRGLYSILALSSLVPCPGAIMVLMFALYMKAVVLGIAAFLAMSVGMGIVVSSAAYLAWFGRTGLFSSLKKRERGIARVAAALEALSYVLMLAFALYTAWPFIVSVVA